MATFTPPPQGPDAQVILRDIIITAYEAITREQRGCRAMEDIPAPPKPEKPASDDEPEKPTFEVFIADCLARAAKRKKAGKGKQPAESDTAQATTPTPASAPLDTATDEQPAADPMKPADEPVMPVPNAPNAPAAEPDEVENESDQGGLLKLFCRAWREYWSARRDYRYERKLTRLNYRLNRKEWRMENKQIRLRTYEQRRRALDRCHGYEKMIANIKKNFLTPND